MKAVILLAIFICTVEVQPTAVKHWVFRSGYYPNYPGYPYPYYYYQYPYYYFYPNSHGTAVLPEASTHYESATPGQVATPTYKYVRLIRNSGGELEGEEEDNEHPYVETQKELDAALQAQNDAPKVVKGFVDKFVDALANNVPKANNV
ncbi:hypothetical protein EVAR_62344_1 [Eumeta japonica]|uniref:Uncharacterized protein n=1 Tax=Eumeta variegata TaxID=151549 RepID=A0A4C1ZM76_EUMVA|nr:hypothetical protein EVAR_62344_1 [Eumeta japonica]